MVTHHPGRRFHYSEFSAEQLVPERVICDGISAKREGFLLVQKPREKGEYEPERPGDTSVFRLHCHCNAVLERRLVPKWGILDLAGMLGEQPGVQLFGDELKCLQSDFADAGAAARERVDVADLDSFLGYRGCAEDRQEGGNYHPMAHRLSPCL